MRRGPSVSEEARSSPAKTLMRRNFFLTDSRTLTRSEITACANQRDAASWRLRDHPNSGVDGDSTENVRVRSITLHHIGNCGSRYSAATEA